MRKIRRQALAASLILASVGLTACGGPSVSTARVVDRPLQVARIEPLNPPPPPAPVKAAPAKPVEAEPAPQPAAPQPAAPQPAAPQPAAPQPAAPQPAAPKPVPEPPVAPEPPKAEPKPATPEPSKAEATAQPATPQPATPQPATPQPATPQPATPQPAAPPKAPEPPKPAATPKSAPEPATPPVVPEPDPEPVVNKTEVPEPPAPKAAPDPVTPEPTPEPVSPKPATPEPAAPEPTPAAPEPTTPEPTPKLDIPPAPEVPDDPAARRQMAGTLLYEAGLHRSKGELDQAIVAFSQALELMPDSFSAFNNRGLTFLEKGAYEDAVADFTSAARLRSDRAFVYTNRATAYQKLGRLEHAIADYSHGSRDRSEAGDRLLPAGQLLLPGRALRESHQGLRRGPRPQSQISRSAQQQALGGRAVEESMSSDDPGASEALVETVDIEVRYAETDAQGVVHHSNYIVWFELARTALCRRTGYSYAEVEAMGYNLVVTGTRTKHRQGARYGDTVQACCTLARFQSRGLSFTYEIRRQDELLATGETEHIWVARETGRPTRLPEPLERGFRSIAGQAHFKASS